MKSNKKKEFKITSVLIPLFNHANFITYCLNSILKSNTKNIQLIISDDCSNDKSYAIAKRWIEVHKHLFFSTQIFQQKKNLGINENINFLKNKASGDFVTVLSSDDAISPSAIDSQSHYLNDHPRIDFLFSNRSLINNFNKTISLKCTGFIRQFFIQNNFFIKLDMIFNWGLPWSGFFGRRKSFLELGQLPKNLSFDDRWISLKILQTNRYAFLNYSYYIYRIRTQGIITPGLDKKTMFEDLKKTEFLILQSSNGILYLLLYLYTLSYKSNVKNPFLKFLYKLPRKLIRLFYNFSSKGSNI